MIFRRRNWQIYLTTLSATASKYKAAQDDFLTAMGVNTTIELKTKL